MMGSRRSYAATAGIVTAGVLASVLVVGSSATAQSGALTFDPPNPAPDTTVSVSGGQDQPCLALIPIFDDEGQQTGVDPRPGTLDVGLTFDDLTDAFEAIPGSASLPPGIDFFATTLDVPANSDGTWTVELTLPPDLTPGAEINVWAACNHSMSAFSRVGSFGVGAPPPAAPPAATPPQASPGAAPGATSPGDAPGAGAGLESAPSPAAPPATPATPVESEPSFVG